MAKIVRRIVHEEIYELNVLTADQAREHLAILGLTQEEGAELCGFSGRSMRWWLSSSGSLPIAVSNCLRAWVTMKSAGLDWYPATKKEST